MARPGLESGDSTIFSCASSFLNPIFWVARHALFLALLLVCAGLGYRKTWLGVAGVYVALVAVGVIRGVNLSVESGEKGIAVVAGVLYAALSIGSAAMKRLLRSAVDRVRRPD